MAIPSKKGRPGDGKINTIDEMIHDSEETLWEIDSMKALVFEGTERRKKLNFWSRFIITLIIILTFSKKLGEVLEEHDFGDPQNDQNLTQNRGF